MGGEGCAICEFQEMGSITEEPKNMRSKRGMYGP